MRNHWIAALIGSMAFVSTALSAPAARRDVLRAAFVAADSDHDGRLNLVEYTALLKSDRGDSPTLSAMAKRDFYLVDQNQDQKLSLVELLMIPTLVPPLEREAWLDSYPAAVDRYFERLDQHFAKSSSRKRQRSVDAEWRVELARYRTELGAALEVSLNHKDLPVVDVDFDDFVTRAEAKQHIAVLLGVTAPELGPLRFRDGRVIKWQQWRQLDVNWDRRITRREFALRHGAVPRFFEIGDLNHDDAVSFDEYCQTSVGHVDVPLLFCQLDQDYDGGLSRAELLAGFTDARQALVDPLFPCFDDDANGKLSYEEFIWTPLGNELLLWWKMSVDSDRDDQLSWHEFRMLTNLVPLLSWEVFRRLDRTQRLWLDRQQLDFKSGRRPRILTLSSDERWFREEVPPLPRGQTLDEIAAGAQRDELLATIWTQSPAIHRLSSGTVTKITDGTAPQVSFGGDRLLVRRFDRQGHPFLITDARGNELREIGRGFDVQWLPDGRVSWIWKDAVVLLRPDKNETIHLPIPDIDALSVNSMKWSPKGDLVALCGHVSNVGYQCVIAEFDGTMLTVRRRIPLDSHVESLVWQSSNRLLLTKHCVERRRCQLYELLPFGDQVPHLVMAQDPRLDHLSVVVSRDGTRVWTMSRDY